MRKIDEAFKRYMADKSILADILNSLFFKGIKIINEDDIEELNVESVSQNLKRRIRDLNYEVHFSNGTTHDIGLIGIEAQSKQDITMLGRIMEYDAQSFIKQLENSTDNPHPCIKRPLTIVFNLGNKPWNIPTSLNQYAPFENKSLTNFFPDYHYLVIDPFNLDTEFLNELHSEFQSVLKLLKVQHDKYKLIQLLSTDPKYRAMSKNGAQLILQITNLEIEINEEDEVLDMTNVWKEIEEDARKIGWDKGVAEGLQEGFQKGIEQGIEKGIEQGIEQGIEKGIEQGIQEGIKLGEIDTKKQIARNLYTLNLSYKDISNAINENIDTIQSWIHEPQSVNQK